jgi:hypothetical protein
VGTARFGCMGTTSFILVGTTIFISVGTTIFGLEELQALNKNMVWFWFGVDLEKTKCWKCF